MLIRAYSGKKDSATAESIMAAQLSPAPFQGMQPSYDPVWLRDSCTCPRCVHPSTKQKQFQSTDVPSNIAISSQKTLADGSLEITWANDIPGFGNDHVSSYSKGFLDSYGGDPYGLEALGKPLAEQTWDAKLISERVKFLNYEEFLSNDSVLYEALDQLKIYGLVFIRGIPDDSAAVESVAGRIGNLRDSFYGRTWDVKSVLQAKNVAYTHQFLGFHMDLLYMSDPPGLQFLHCIRNSCEGGLSMFSDSFYAAMQVWKEDPALFNALVSNKTYYHYDNAGEHYRKAHATVVLDPTVKAGGDIPSIDHVNWSPPFQAPFALSDGVLDKNSISRFREYMEASKRFAFHAEATENTFQYRLGEGECVIFNNRRTLHARTAFDIQSGERWLKGAYVDTDVFLSRYRVLRRRFVES